MFSEEQHQQNLRVRALELSVKVFENSAVEQRLIELGEEPANFVLGQAANFYNFLKGENQ